MDCYSKFILSVIAIGIWFLAFAVFTQPAPIEAYGAQEVKITGWSTDVIVQVDLKKIGGRAYYAAMPISVRTQD